MDKESFFASKVKTQPVPLDDGETVFVRKLSQNESETLTNDYPRDPKKQAAGFRFIVCKTMVTEDGSPVFEDKDLARLGSVPTDRIQVIASAAIEFSGMAPKDAGKKD